MPNELVPSASNVLLIVASSFRATAYIAALRAARMGVAWATSLAELLGLVDRRDLPHPEVVFLDLDLGDAAPEAVIGVVRQRFPLALLVALSPGIDRDQVAGLLAQGVPSLSSEVTPQALSRVALQLAARRRPNGAPAPGETTESSAIGSLDAALESYAELNTFSARQRSILRHYLAGYNDKEIARRLDCAESTVYEHWRRMARKVGGTHKGDVVSRFHHFLAHGWRGDVP